MNARSSRMLALLLALLSGCTHSGSIFVAKEEEPEADAGTVSESYGGSELDAGEDGGVVERDAGTVTLPALSAYEHSCTVRVDGSYCWGRNADGQLGVGGGPPFVTTPTQLVRGLLYTQLCAGERHSCGLRPDGRIDCWGGNAKGQLGLDDRISRDEPTSLRPSVSVDFKALACGGNVSCAVGKDEQLYCWGDNLEGQGGQNDPPNSPDLLVPMRVDIEPGIAQVTVGQGHVCALTNAGTLYCWGRNNHGQLGLGAEAAGQVRKPTQQPGGASYLSVGAGQMHSCAVRKDRRLFCWGWRAEGRLGLGPGGSGDLPEPSQVGSLADYQSVQANWFHSCALRASGVLSCWGRNEEGQLGLGDTELREEPANVSGLDAVTALAVGHFHTCALRAGAVYCWGENKEGQLGLGNVDRRNLPARVSF
jgi:alpha-tubulin suppressor-like RCC1 family protein